MGDIKLLNVTRRFDNGHEALANVSTQFGDGSMTFLTGHSGAGKSTFLKLLLRADVPTRGRILVNDVDIVRLSTRKLPFYRQHVGVVFQDHNLLAQRTVFDNVAVPLHVTGMGAKDISRRVRAALTRVELLGKENLYPRHLSTGEQQRVGIARAVVTRPNILLADEPTGNLDPELSSHIMDLFVRVNQTGTTVIVASHDVQLISALGMRILHLEQGRIAGDTAVGDPLGDPQELTVDAQEAR
ncbi:MAG: cell division ATP-binding protein FtsE [Pseudomonadota bacterium]